MARGVFLILVILLIVIGGGIMASDRGRARNEHRPRHIEPAEDDPVQQHTHLVGTPEGGRAMRERD